MTHAGWIHRLGKIPATEIANEGHGQRRQEWNVDLRSCCPLELVFKVLYHFGLLECQDHRDSRIPEDLDFGASTAFSGPRLF